MTGRGYFGVGVWHSKNSVNVGTLMRSAFAFGAKFAFTVGRRYSRQQSDTCDTSAHLPLYHMESIEQLRRHLPLRCRIVGVEITDDAKDLCHFAHPLQACYLLGAEDHGLNKHAIEACHEIIRIPSAICLNVASAGTVVMYDRIAKQHRLQSELRQSPKQRRRGLAEKFGTMAI